MEIPEKDYLSHSSKNKQKLFEILTSGAITSPPLFRIAASTTRIPRKSILPRSFRFYKIQIKSLVKSNINLSSKNTLIDIPNNVIDKKLV